MIKTSHFYKSISINEPFTNLSHTSPRSITISPYNRILFAGLPLPPPTSGPGVSRTQARPEPGGTTDNTNNQLLSRHLEV